MRRLRRGFAVAAGAGLFALAGTTPIAARAAGPAASIALSPSVATLTVAPGKTTTETVTVTNGSTTGVHVSGAIGDLAPVLDGFGPATAGSPGVFGLPAGGATSVTVTIRVPVGSTPGGHYAGVLFSASAPGSTRVVSSSMHSLLLEVPGAGITRIARVNGI